MRSHCATVVPAPVSGFQIYTNEFDVAYDERGLFILTMHPHMVRHRSRVAHLDRFIAYMKSKPGVWFATLEQVARARLRRLPCCR